MIENFNSSYECETVLKLVSLTEKSLEEMLLELGIAVENIDETAIVVEAVSQFITPSVDQIIDKSFTPTGAQTPFRATRFSDGTIAIYYSAIEAETCQSEVAFHAIEDSIEPFNQLRFYNLIECSYQGSTIDLRGFEEEHQELTSETKDGYPFCQELGRMANINDIDGFFTPSARKEGGTCVPVFSKSAVSNPKFVCKYQMTISNGTSKFQQLPSP